MSVSKIKGKQIADGAITQGKFNITTASVVNPTDATTKGYVDNEVNYMMTGVTNNLSNLNMSGLTVTSGTGYQQVCSTAILVQPISLVSVTVNGVEVNVGPGLDCVFSPDGSTLRTPGSEIIGDYMYWNTNVARFMLDTTDEIDFDYLTR